VDAAAASGNSMWEQRYSEEEYAYGTAPNDFLKETVPSLKFQSVPSGKCLLLADGEGRNGVFMAEQNLFDQVVSLDYSPVGLEKAKKLAKSRNVELETIEADLADYDLGTDKWDCIVGIFCHFPPPIRAEVLEGIPAALKSGGYFILECYTPDQIKNGTGGPPVAAPMYSKQILDDFLGQKLQIERNEELERTVSEGKYHKGNSAVVQFIGRKAVPDE